MAGLQIKESDVLEHVTEHSQHSVEFDRIAKVREEDQYWKMLNNTFRGNKSTYTIMAEREGFLVIVGFDTEYSSGMGISNPYFTKVSVFQVPMAGYLDKDS
jgi:hypothetical protein